MHNACIHNCSTLQAKPDVKNLVAGSSANGVHLTVDLWTTISRVGVMGLKLHFITKEWTYKTITIALSELNESHTSENIKAKFDGILDSYEFDRNKVFYTYVYLYSHSKLIY